MPFILHWDLIDRKYKGDIACHLSITNNVFLGQLRYVSSSRILNQMRIWKAKKALWTITNLILFMFHVRDLKLQNYLLHEFTFYFCIRKHIKFFKFMQCNFVLIHVNCRTFFPSTQYTFFNDAAAVAISTIFISGWSLVFWPTNVWRQLHNKRGKWEKEMDDPWPVFQYFSPRVFPWFCGKREKKEK